MRLSIIVSRAGGGHVASAKALSALLTKTYPLDIRIVDFYETVVPHLDPVRRLMGKSADDFYNQYCLGKPYGGLLASALVTSLPFLGITLQRKTERALISEFEENPPDLIVSVTPHINRFIIRAANCLNIPTSIMVTDLFELYRGFWIPPNVRNALVPEEALNRIPAGRRTQCTPVTLPLVRTPFYESFEGAKTDDRPNCLVVFGGHGSSAMIRVADALKPFEGRITADFVCGHSKAVKSTLDGLDLPEGFRTHGYVEDIHRLYRQADFVLGKTGPGVIVESILSGSYPILLGGWWGIPQERPNIGWLNTTGLGCVVGTLQGLIDELQSRLSEKPVIHRRLRDKALSDPETITAFFGQILDRSGPPSQQRGLEAFAS